MILDFYRDIICKFLNSKNHSEFHFVQQIINTVLIASTHLFFFVIRSRDSFNGKGVDQWLRVGVE